MATVDFFISYAEADPALAECIAWQLEASGYHKIASLGRSAW